MSHVPITRTLVAEEDRVRILREYFGTEYRLFQGALHVVTKSQIPDYQGSYWDLFTLSNGGAFMAPTHANVRKVVSSFGLHGLLSQETTGVVMTLNTLSFLSVALPDEADAIMIRFKLLLAYALDHHERALIFAAIT